MKEHPDCMYYNGIKYVPESEGFEFEHDGTVEVKFIGHTGSACAKLLRGNDYIYIDCNHQVATSEIVMADPVPHGCIAIRQSILNDGDIIKISPNLDVYISRNGFDIISIQKYNGLFVI